MGFLLDIVASIISKAPVERILFPPPDRTKHLKELAELLPSEADLKQLQELPTEVQAVPGVSDHDTLSYQLDLILDDLDHLETEHLPSKGRIAGQPCDCIAKAGRSLRRHSKETIPIAARQGQDTAIYSEAADWAGKMMEIGTVEAVVSGEYDAQYPLEAGTASKLRKRFQKVLTSLRKPNSEKSELQLRTVVGKTEPACPECSELQDLSAYIERKRAEREGS